MVSAKKNFFSVVNGREEDALRSIDHSILMETKAIGELSYARFVLPSPHPPPVKPGP
jgi:hypothetical protein